MYEFNKDQLAALQQTQSALQTAAFKSYAGDTELAKFIDGNATYQNILFDELVSATAKNQSKVLLPQEVERVQEIMSESGAADKLTDMSTSGAVSSTSTDVDKLKADANKWDIIRQMNPENMQVEPEDPSIFSKGFGDIFAWIFMFLGAIIITKTKYPFFQNKMRKKNSPLPADEFFY
jgi:hypothetical protein